MTKLLEDAFKEAGQLPEDAQDEFARWLLAELASERRWSQLFEKSPEALSRLAREALAEHRRGETTTRSREALKSSTTRQFRECFAGLPRKFRNVPGVLTSVSRRIPTIQVFDSRRFAMTRPSTQSE